MSAFDTNGKPLWKVRLGQVRFTPWEEGLHRFRVVVTRAGKAQHTPWHRLRVEGADPRGFVRGSQEDPRYFETADNEWFALLLLEKS